MTDVRKLLTDINVRMMAGINPELIVIGPPRIDHDLMYGMREAAQARGPAAFNAPGRSRHKKGKR